MKSQNLQPLLYCPSDRLWQLLAKCGYKVGLCCTRILPLSYGRKTAWYTVSAAVCPQRGLCKCWELVTINSVYLLLFLIKPISYCKLQTTLHLCVNKYRPQKSTNTGPLISLNLSFSFSGFVNLRTCRSLPWFFRSFPRLFKQFGYRSSDIVLWLWNIVSWIMRGVVVVVGAGTRWRECCHYTSLLQKVFSLFEEAISGVDCGEFVLNGNINH